MRVNTKTMICVCALAYGQIVLAADPGAEITALRDGLDELRRDYETRIAELEQRLAAAERAAQRSNSIESAPVQSGPRAGNAAFNPAIGVIFQGQAWSYQRDPESSAIPGFPLGGESAPVVEGLAIGETEIDMSANVDDKFTAWLTLPVVVEDGATHVEIEEAWLETLALPGGFSARFGRFFSGVGYQNGRHAHSWDFIDQPLPYRAFLGGQYLDDGIQLRWLAPTDLYLELGAEVLNGARYPAGGSADSGFGTRSMFARAGGDLNDSSSWLAGLSYLHAKSVERSSGAEDAPLLFTGDSDLIIAQLVWKWSPHGNWKQRNLVLQSEYLWRREDGAYLLPDESRAPYDADQNGWYVQAVYQPFPRWRFGGRFDRLSADESDPAFAGTELATTSGHPKRYSVMVDWSNSEFSRLRLQYTRDESLLRPDHQWGVQYLLSIGAHGAHAF